MILVFWLFFIRPQAKKAKNQKKFIEDLQRGDKIVTIAGIHGTINKVNDDGTTLNIETSPDQRADQQIAKDGRQIETPEHDDRQHRRTQQQKNDRQSFHCFQDDVGPLATQGSQRHGKHGEKANGL